MRGILISLKVLLGKETVEELEKLRTIASWNHSQSSVVEVT